MIDETLISKDCRVSESHNANSDKKLNQKVLYHFTFFVTVNGSAAGYALIRQYLEINISSIIAIIAKL